MNVISGYEWDLERRNGRRGAAQGSKLFSAIGQGLRQAYGDVLDQDVPEELMSLIQRLEERERGGRSSVEG